jgi:hypothetical protein
MRVQSWIGRRPAGRPGISVRLVAAAIVAAAGTAAPAVASTRGDLARAQRDAHVEAQRVSDAALRARIIVDWAAGVTGGWFDPTRWSGGVVPQNDGVDEYDATIAAPGLYTVLINGDAHVSTLAMTAADATLELFSGSLMVEEGFTLSNGTFRLRDGVATLGSVNLTSGLFDIDGGVLEVGGVLRSAGATLRFDAGTIRNTVYDGDDTRLLITGRTGRTFDNVTITDGALTLGATQGLRIVNGLQTINGGGLIVDGGRLEFAGTQTLTGVNLQAADNWENEFAVLAGAELTIADDMVLDGHRFKFFGEAGSTFINYGRTEEAWFDITPGHLINHGTMNDGLIAWATWENYGRIEGADLFGGSWVNYGEIIDSERISGDFVNYGLIQHYSRNALAVDGTWRNEGTIRVTPGRGAILAGQWENNGVIDASGARVFLGGAYGHDDLAGVVAVDGEVFLQGEFENSGMAFETGSRTGDWVLDQVVVHGGSLRLDQSPNLRIGWLTLDGVDVYGDAVVESDWRQSAMLRIGAGGFSMIDGDVYLGYNGTLAFLNDATIDGFDIFADDSNDSLDEGGIAVSNGVTATLGPDAAFIGQGHIRGAWSGTGLERFINKGRIESTGTTDIETSIAEFVNEGTLQAGGFRFELAAAHTINTGLIEALDGARLTHRGRLTNDGVIRADNAEVWLAGDYVTGDFRGLEIANGGLIRFTGALDNAGATIETDAPGLADVLLEGRITGGVIDSSSGQSLNIGDALELESVTFRGGDFVVDRPGAVVSFLDAPQFDGVGLRLQDQVTAMFAGGTVLDSAFPIWMDNPSGGFGPTIRAVGGDQSLTIGEHVDLHIGNGGFWGGTITSHADLTGARDGFEVWFSGRLQNYGSIGDSASATDGVFRFGANDVENYGDIRLVHGSDAVWRENGGGSGEFRNAGLLELGAGSEAYFGDAFINEGEVLVSGGVFDAAEFRNTGLLRMTGGEVHLRGDRTTAQLAGIETTGGVLRLYGDWDNTGATKEFNASTGAWRLENVDLTGGVVRYADGLHAAGDSLVLTNTTIEAGRFDFRRLDVFEGVTIAGGDFHVESARIWRDLDYTGGDFVLGNGDTLEYWFFDTNYEIDTYNVRSEANPFQPGFLAFTTLRIAEGASVTGAVNIGGIQQNGGVLQHDGLLQLSAPGATLFIRGTTLSGTGDIEVGANTTVVIERSSFVLDDGAWGGDLRFGAGSRLFAPTGSTLPQITRNANRLSVDGPVPDLFFFLAGIGRNDGEVFLSGGAAPIFTGAPFVNNGLISIDSASSLGIGGGFLATGESTLRFEIDGAAAMRAGEQLTVNGALTLGGALEITLADALNLAIGDRIDLITATGGRTGVFDSTMLAGLGDGLRFQVDYTAAGVSLVVVPTPNTAALFALTGLAAARRRRR